MLLLLLADSVSRKSNSPPRQCSSLSAYFEKSSEGHENQHKDTLGGNKRNAGILLSTYFLKWAAALKKIVFLLNDFQFSTTQFF